VVHTPVHASGRHQVDIFFSIVQHAVLTPNDFVSSENIEKRLRIYEALSNQQPHPLAWKFPRAKLVEFVKRLEAHHTMLDQEQAVLELPDIAQGELLAR
jgi:hypothetical protein